MVDLILLKHRNIHHFRFILPHPNAFIHMPSPAGNSMVGSLLCAFIRLYTDFRPGTVTLYDVLPLLKQGTVPSREPS
jgi:hypothetical protein